MIPSGAPPAEVDVTVELATSLLAGQHPDLAHLPIGTRFDGWDNVTFRLGDELALRLPRIAAGAALLLHELTWLPVLSAHWTFAAPVPLRRGEPAGDYPWAWSVVPWIAGVEAAEVPLTAAAAPALGRAMREIHQTAPDDAPRNPSRSVPLAARDQEFRECVGELLTRAPGAGMTLDGNALLRHWEAAISAPVDSPPTWIHADLHVRNIVSRGGNLGGILDWGDSAAGDPCVDLGQAWQLLPAEAVDDCFAAYGRISDALRLRAFGSGAFFNVSHALEPSAVHSRAGWTGLVRQGLATAAR